MGITIVGSGISGLVAAIQCKLIQRDADILVIGDDQTGNSRIAGQRYWTRNPGDPQPSVEAIETRLKDRNDGRLVPQMSVFAQNLVQQVGFWQNFQPDAYGLSGFAPLDYIEKQAWFGPQLGRQNKRGEGLGSSVQKWLRDLAKALNVRFLKADIQKIVHEGDEVVGLYGHRGQDPIGVTSSHYILAGGNLGGRMFTSTSVPIQNTPQELAYAAGIPLTDPTLFMFHVFAKAGPKGEARLGCYESDILNEAQVFLKNPKTDQFDLLDEETTDLLSRNAAHYHFGEIAKRFHDHGSVVHIKDRDGRLMVARLSHHYSHLAVKTSDGVQVSGMRNLWAVGDASGTAYWSNHQLRYPGQALGNCLVSGYLTAQRLPWTDPKMDEQVFVHQTDFESIRQEQIRRRQSAAEAQIKAINTKGILGHFYGNQRTDKWLNALTKLNAATASSEASAILEISLLTARALNSVKPKTWPIVISKSDL